jgi:hypothetical protein
MGGKKGIALIVSFMGLPEVHNGLNIRFTLTERSKLEIGEVNLLIEKMAFKLVKRHCGRDLQYKSLSELAAHMYQMSLLVEPEKDLGPEITVNKRRKTSAELGPRQLSNCGKEIVNYVVKNLCVKDEEATKYTTAEITQNILQNRPVYYELVSKNIDRWNEVRNMVKKKPGRKNNEGFEAAVWSKLMICEFEKIMVIFIYFVLLYIHQFFVYTM